MRHRRYYALILPLLPACISACKNVTSANDTSLIRGRMVLMHDAFSTAPPYSGISVALEGTDFITHTDDSGYYEFRNVPEGHYNVHFTKAGFGDIRWMGLAVQAARSPIVWNGAFGSYMYERPTTVIRLEAAAFIDSTLPGSNVHYSFLKTAGKRIGAKKGSAIAVFVNRTSDVSCAPGHFVNYFLSVPGLCRTLVCDSVTDCFSFPILKENLQSLGFADGDSIYVAAYAAPEFREATMNDYYDADLDRYVLSSTNQTPSPVIGLKLP